MLDFIGLFIFLAGLIIGLGAVTVIDIHGFLGRKSSYWTEATTRTHKVTKPLIWIGIAFAIIGGIILSLNATALVNFIQQTFHVQFISSSVYFVDYLPAQLQWSDVLSVGGLAFLLSLLATIYPAWHSFRIQPAEALRYE